MELGRLKEAEERLRLSVDRNPKAGELWKVLAQCLRRTGDWRVRKQSWRAR